MAKARVTLNDEEKRQIEGARTLSKLQAQRRLKASELADIDKNIAEARKALGIGTEGTQA